MDLSQELELLDALAAHRAISPQRVILETWKLLERVLIQCFPQTSHSPDGVAPNGASLLAGIEKTKRLEVSVLKDLRAVYQEKEAVAYTGLTIYGETQASDDRTERPWPDRAWTCIETTRRILNSLSHYQPRRCDRVLDLRLAESGPQRAVGFGGNRALMVLGAGLAASLWVASFMIFPRSAGHVSVPEAHPSPFPTATGSTPSTAAEILGFWRRSDGLTLRFVPHKERPPQRIGFIVTLPQGKTDSSLGVRDIALVVEATAEGTYRGLQRWTHASKDWTPLEFSIQGRQIVTGGGVFTWMEIPQGDSVPTTVRRMER